MAGHILVVHKVIDDKYPSAALFFHCASHVLYLVINDLNTVSEARNISGTTNGIINFFSSMLRQNYIYMKRFRQQSTKVSENFLMFV